MWCFFCKQKTAYEMSISECSSDVCSSDLHVEEFGVCFGRANLVENEFHGFDFVHVMNEFAQYPYFLEQVRAYQELFAAGAGLVEIDGRIYALLGQAAFKMNLGIAGAFEFFVYDFVHATAGFDRSEEHTSE